MLKRATAFSPRTLARSPNATGRVHSVTRRRDTLPGGDDGPSYAPSLREIGPPGIELIVALRSSSSVGLVVAAQDWRRNTTARSTRPVRSSTGLEAAAPAPPAAPNSQAISGPPQSSAAWPPSMPARYIDPAQSVRR